MLKKKIRRFAWILRIIVASVIVLIVSSPIYAAQDSIRLGATVSLEGRYARVSFMVKKGYELWAEEVNQRGGILGRKVELIFYDDKSRSDLVGPLYEKLITEDKVDMVLSPYGSTLTMHASEVTEKHGYVMLAASASAVKIWERGYNYVFGVYSTADRYFIGFLDLAAREKMKNVGVVFSNTSFNISAAEGVKKWAGLFGLEVEYFESYDNYKEELPDIIERMRSKSVENLVFCGYPPECYYFLQLLEKKGVRPPGLALTIVPALSDFYSKVGSFAEGIFGSSQWEADERLPFPGSLNFVKKFMTFTGEEPSYHACSSYSACQIIEKAILHAGVIDQEKIRKFVADLDTVTIMGRFKVDFNGQQIGHNPILIQWQNGKKEIVYPTKMRTAPARFFIHGKK